MKFTYIILVVQLAILSGFCLAQPSISLKPAVEQSTIKADVSESERAAIRKQWLVDDAKIQEYIKANDIEIYWLKSGLYYSLIQQGNGEVPNINSVVKVKYTLTTLDGAPVWSTYKTGGPEVRALKDFVNGVVEGLQFLKPGGKMKLYIPSFLAYGTEGWGKKIPANTCIIYDIELMEVYN